MNRRVCVCVGLILGVVVAINSARGQGLPPASSQGLAPNIKTATNAASYTKDIRAFIQDQVTRLQSADVAAQAQARRRLVDECPGGAAVSPSFYAVYVKEWSDAAKPLVAAGSPMRLRLNSAIITAGLAATATIDNSKTMDIEPVVDALLADREGCVALWGIRAARPLIMVVIQQPPVSIPGKPGTVSAVSVSKLVAAVVASIKSHADSDLAGFLVLDGYHALVVREIPGMADADVKKLLPPLVAPVLDVLEFRIARYVAGKIPNPGAERDVTTFLSAISYTNATPAEKNRIVVDLVNLVTYAGERASLYTAKQELIELRGTINYAALALSVIAGYVGDQGTVNGLSWITNFSPSSTPAEIEAHTKSVWNTMNLAFHNLPKPAPIPVMTPPPPAPPVTPSSPGTPTPTPPTPPTP